MTATNMCACVCVSGGGWCKYVYAWKMQMSMYVDGCKYVYVGEGVNMDVWEVQIHMRVFRGDGNTYVCVYVRVSHICNKEN